MTGKHVRDLYTNGRADDTSLGPVTISWLFPLDARRRLMKTIPGSDFGPFSRVPRRYQNPPVLLETALFNIRFGRYRNDVSFYKGRARLIDLTFKCRRRASDAASYVNGTFVIIENNTTRRAKNSRRSSHIPRACDATRCSNSSKRDV